MGSSRLPGKVLREAGGNTLLWHLARRLGRARTPDTIVVATTTDASDTGLAEAAAALGLVVHRGPVDDVLARFSGALDALAAADDDIVVRVTGDCPLLDPDELDRLVDEFRALSGGNDSVDYLTNQEGAKRTIPQGLDVEVFRAGALRRADRESDAPGDREHVTPYLYRPGGGAFRTAVSAPSGRDLSYLRLTVDEAADLVVVDAVVTALGPEASTLAVARWLDEHPEILAINAGTRQKSFQSENELRRQRIDGGLLLARADAGANIGFGHVARVTAVVEAWLELGGGAAVVGTGIAGGALQRLENLGATVVHAGAAAFESRAPQALALVVDGYEHTETHHRRWASLGKAVLAIDDLAEFEPIADVVVNQNLDFESSRYGDSEARLLVGNAYVLLRGEFRRDREGVAPQRRILMTFGGSDPARLTLTMVQAVLASTGPDVCIDVVMGPGMPDEDRLALERIAGEQPRAELHHDVRDMAALMRSATVAVTAAGGTTWELMACGVPLALVAVADNQRVVLAGVERRDAGLSLGWHQDLDVNQAAAAVASLLADERRRARLSTKGRALVDGRGVLRVIDALLDAVDRRRQE